LNTAGACCGDHAIDLGVLLRRALGDACCFKVELRVIWRRGLIIDSEIVDGRIVLEAFSDSADVFVKVNAT
jgi:hypothetical protein